MTKILNHPLKRLALVLFVASSVSFLLSVVLPEAFAVRSEPDWRDASRGESVERQVTRLDTSCAGDFSGGIQAFAKDFFILNAALNPYSRDMTIETIESQRDFTIASKLDITAEERDSFRSQLSAVDKPCLLGECVRTLTPARLDELLEACGTVVGQHQHNLGLYLADSLWDHAAWSIASLISMFVFLLLSLLYDKTLGPVVRWIRSG